MTTMVNNIEGYCDIDAYCDWVSSLCNAGYKPFLLTFMFRPIRFSPKKKKDIMEDAIARFYSRVVTRFTRNPNRTAELDQRPILIAAADLPVHKTAKITLRDASVNGGLHFHGMFLRPPVSRFQGSFKAYVRDNQEALIAETSMARIHVEVVRYTPEYATQYALKSLARGLIEDGEVMVLPDSVRKWNPTNRGYDEAVQSYSGASVLYPGRRPL